MDFKELLQKMDRELPAIRVLGIDPGETTGWVILDPPCIYKAGQEPTKNVTQAALFFNRMLEDKRPDVIVIEEYRVYSSKTRQHAWNDLLTARIIGAIEALCAIEDVPVVKQTASTAKGFCTNDKLREWGFWQSSAKRHANDAIRHACYYTLFHKISAR